MAWQTPIFDRTAQDVQAGADQCYVDAGLLNRIEGNTRCLAEMVHVQIATRTWHSTDFLTPHEYQRIVENIAAVRDAYYAMPGTALPKQPSTHYKAINAIEQMLWGIRELWERNSRETRYTGEGFAGQAIGVI